MAGVLPYPPHLLLLIMKKLLFVLLAVYAVCMVGCTKDKTERHNYLTIDNETHPFDMAGTMIANSSDDTYHFDANDTCLHFHIFGEFAASMVGKSVSLIGESCQTPYWLGINANASSFAIYTGWWNADDVRTDFSSGIFSVSKKDGMMIVHAEGVLLSGEQLVMDIAVPENEIHKW